MLALLFPGQGSQELGMGRDACQGFAAAREVFEAADAAVGFPLSRICFEGPESELRRTEIQQPAVLAVSVALLNTLRGEVEVDPAYVAGHSLGEYSALVASGALRLYDALSLVHARGRYMQEAVPEGRGAMAAVLACPPKTVEECCAAAQEETGRVVSAANYNSPAQTVIAGDALAVEVACTRARAAGARRTIPLPVSAPFHCALMAPVAEKLGLELAQVPFSDPHPPVVTNVEARPNADGRRLPELLRAQVTAPVRFTEMVEQLVALGVERVLEVGPGRVLTGLVGRIAPGLERANLSCVEDLPAAVRFVTGGRA